MNDARGVIERAAAAHREGQRGSDLDLVSCACGWVRRPENIVGDGTYRAHVADAILAALSEAGLTVCGEQVGTQDRDGFLHELRQQVEGRPVFIESEEPK